MQNQQAWGDELEKEFKNTIHNYFDEKINDVLQEGNALQIGDNLGQLLKDSENDIVKIITPRAVKKWASPATLPLWEEFLNNDQMLLELREIGKSIANSMRPLAGNSRGLLYVFCCYASKTLVNKFFFYPPPAKQKQPRAVLGAPALCGRFKWWVCLIIMRLQIERLRHVMLCMAAGNIWNMILTP